MGLRHIQVVVHVTKEIQMSSLSDLESLLFQSASTAGFGNQQQCLMITAAAMSLLHVNPSLNLNLITAST